MSKNKEKIMLAAIQKHSEVKPETKIEAEVKVEESLKSKQS